MSITIIGASNKPIAPYSWSASTLVYKLKYIFRNVSLPGLNTHTCTYTHTCAPTPTHPHISTHVHSYATQTLVCTHIQAWERVLQLQFGQRPGDSPSRNLYCEVMSRYLPALCLLVRWCVESCWGAASCWAATYCWCKAWVHITCLVHDFMVLMQIHRNIDK
jgi:hypothetical protein